jgi:hypothetical protein
VFLISTQLKGVVGADLSLSYVNEFLSSLTIGKTGEAFVLDKNGYFIGSSKVDRIGSNFTVVYTHSTMIVDQLVRKFWGVLEFLEIEVTLLRLMRV